MQTITFFFVSVLFFQSFVSAATLPRDHHALNKRDLLTLNELFRVKTIPEGSCADRLGDLQTYVQEASDMVDAAIRVLKVYESDDIGRRSLTVYLGVHPNAATVEEELGAVRTWFADLRDWLDTARLPDPDASPVYLYCDSPWAQRQQPDDLAWAARLATDPLPDINDPNADNNPRLEHLTAIENGEVVVQRINQVADYRDVMQTPVTDPVSGQTFNPVPYWSKDLREYVFERDYPRGYCGVAEHFAGTDTDTVPNTVTLCPQSFQRGTATLGSGNPGVGSWIGEESNVMPRSLTLLHELGHLVQGQQDTKDYANHPGACLGYALNPSIDQRKLGRQSPECYALFALAMWYKQERRLDYQTFYAQAIRAGQR